MLATSAFAVAVAALVLTVRSIGRADASLIGETIVVHTRHPDDRSIRGVVVGWYADRIVLRGAAELLSADSRAAIPDLAEIPRGAVSWWQRIEPRE
jgi:hypothetical protein